MMRMSQFFPYTLHQAPAEAEQVSHQLLLRAGLLRPLGAGAWAWLPLGRRVQRRLQSLAQKALIALGGQEIALPPLLPTSAWQEGSAWEHIARESLSLQDAAHRTLFWPDRLGPLLTLLLRSDLRSHRLLPQLFYDFRQRSWTGHPAGSPLAAAQSLVLEMLALQADSASLADMLRELEQGLRQLARACGLELLAAEAVVGPDDLPARALFCPQVPGSEPLLRCPACGYVAEGRVARRAKATPLAEQARSLEELYTPNCPTIAALADFLEVPASRTAKAVLMVSGDCFFFVIVRGDMDLDESKLARHMGVEDLRPAEEDEIAALGASPGFASPLGIRRQAPEVGLRQVHIVVDELLPHCPNLVMGANKEDYHLRNVNYGRDYTADSVADLVAVHGGDPCPHCQELLVLERRTILGRLWAVGSRYSGALGATFQDAAGQERPWQLACAEVDLDRLLAACVEVHHDERGILWPVRLAPYQVYLLSLGDAPELQEASASLYEELRRAGIAVLWDDRDERAGFKFADADLLGMPLRIALSKRTLQQQGAEVKRRTEPREAVLVIPLVDVPAWVERALAELETIV
ncbi:MAG: hypothetical protein JXA37_02105 [Chloroflexia bacterium]|nr:hypothetical protein [Chloroflexia bacterium]